MLLSSTVMTPSLPTRSNASPISSPTSGSWAEMVATSAIVGTVVDRGGGLVQRGVHGVDGGVHAAAEASGLAPAATLRMPSWTSAWASTVAVVVPSPATSLVLVATLFASCAPRFS